MAWAAVTQRNKSSEACGEETACGHCVDILSCPNLSEVLLKNRFWWRCSEKGLKFWSWVGKGGRKPLWKNRRTTEDNGGLPFISHSEECTRCSCLSHAKQTSGHRCSDRAARAALSSLTSTVPSPTIPEVGCVHFPAHSQAFGFCVLAVLPPPTPFLPSSSLWLSVRQTGLM